MKIRLMIVMSMAICLFAGGCRRQAPELRVYTWADYFKPELLQRFEKQQGCRIIIDTFESNESMYAKIRAGAGGYDVLTPTSYFVKILKKQGYLRALDHRLLPNLIHVDPDYLRIAMDPRMEYSVPYMLTNTGIAYRKSKVKDFTPSWKMFYQGALKGRVTMLNDMRETIGAALKYLGYSINSRDLKELEAARDVVIAWKKNLAKFESEQYKNGIASGEFLMVHGYSGDLLQVKSENEDVEFFIPVEGTSVSCDDLVIAKNARDVGLAHAFINFLHDPAVAAENTNFLSYVCPNKTSYPMVSEKLRKNPAVFLPDEVKARCEVIDDLGADTAKYNRIWDDIKAAK